MADEEMGDVYFTVSSSCKSQVLTPQLQLCVVICSAIRCEEFKNCLNCEKMVMK